MSNQNSIYKGIVRSLMILAMSFSLSTYSIIGDVTGQSLWCIVKQIADTADTVESKLFALEIGLSTLDALIAQEILIAVSETELVIEKFSSVDSLIDVVGSQLCVLASQAEIISSLIDPIESQLDAITACSSMFILAPTTINASGTYCLANDITGPIEINASNVVLSLNNHTVTGNVSITAGQNLVTIENGVVENTSSADAITIQSGASNITIERVTAKNALRGINCIEAAGVMLTHCDLVGNSTGIELTRSYAVSMNACTALANQKSGFSLVSSYTNSIRNCYAMSTGKNNTDQSNNNVYGFVAQNSSGNIFENCIANATQALSTTDYNSIIAGFSLTGTSCCNKIIDCEAANAATSASGVTVPYGIYLQEYVAGLSSTTLLVPQGNYIAFDITDAFSWSPDGVYLLVGVLRDPNNPITSIYLYQYDRAQQSLTQIASLGQELSVYDIAWSPDGRFFAVGGNYSKVSNFRIYSFDKTNQSITLVAQDVSINSLTSNRENIRSVAWSPDMKYLAIGGQFLDQVSIPAASLRLYSFNQVTNALQVQSNMTLANTDGVNPFVQSIEWSPDGAYVAVGGLLIANQLRIYALNTVSNILAQVAAVDYAAIGAELGPVTWSSDGKYLLANRNGRIFVYNFAKSPAVSLTQLLDVATGYPFRNVVWSPDGRYIAAGAGLASAIVMYAFDRSLPVSLRQVASTTFSPSLDSALAWSPDGRLIAGMGNTPVVIYNALGFPSDNVITNNETYCNSGGSIPSGAGISASSICNYVVGNTSYSNPIDPFAIQTNYFFACNVFNQLFNNMPTASQNISLATCEPIAMPDNEALLALQAYTKADFSSMFAVLGSAVDSLTMIDRQAQCSPTPITTPTTISVAGAYCLSTQITGSIVITASEVVLDLNDHTVSAGVAVSSNLDRITIKNGTIKNSASADALSIASGCSNITISHVTAQNARRGIYCDTVHGASIENCDLMYNVTGVELNQSSNVYVSKTYARNNTHSGFALISSYTSIITECQALSTGLNNSAVLNNNVYGFVAQNSFGNVFENCIANAAQALSTTDYNSIVAGFALTGTSNCNKIIGCEAANAITDASGVTVPYGIYLKPEIHGLSAVTTRDVPSTFVHAARLSSDGMYMVVAGNIIGNDVYIYFFNRETEALTLLASANPDGGSSSDIIYEALWSPDNEWVAVGGNLTTSSVCIFRFNRTNNELQEVASANPGGSGEAYSIAWTPDGQYLAVVGNLPGQVYVYSFDKVAQTLTEVTSISPGGLILTSSWSPDGKYLTVGGSTGVFIYRFNGASLTLVDSESPGFVSFVVPWSPDGQYLAVLGDGSNAFIYRFNPITETLTFVASNTITSIGNFLVGGWSPDGRWLAGGSADSNESIAVWYFDRGTNTLTLAIPIVQPGGNVNALSWSPDGQYLIAGGTFTGNDLIIYSILSFPSDNVIKDNTVYCNSGAQYPSGVGISGTSICNYIVGNTAYSNPINPLIVSSNYQFVCNVFNQLFQDVPTLLQNIALGSCEPISITPDNALLAKQLQSQCAGLSSIIDSIGIDIDIAVSYIDALGACNPSRITSATTITASGSYCLANDVVGAVTISANNVVLNLNGHTVSQISVSANQSRIIIKDGTVKPTSSSSDAITVNTGCSYVTIQDVTVKNARYGINILSSYNTTIDHCELTRNVTGLELNQAASIVIQDTVARSNTKSGFSLVSSYTCTISDCKALSTGENNNAELTNNVYGFIAQNSFSNVFENCIANATQALSTTDYNSVVAGFALTGTSNCNKIIGCEAANAITKASGVTVPYGIYLQGTISGDLITITEVNPGEGAIDDVVRMVSWSSDGVYLAIGGSINSSTGDDVYIYQFNRTSQGLTQVAALNPGGGGQEDSVQAVKWSPSGMYLAVAGNMSSSENNLYVYSFDRINNTVTQVVALAPVSAGSDALYDLSWSPDEQYLAVSGTIGGSGRVYIYQFNSVAQTLTFITQSSALADQAEGVSWSPDGRYIAVGVNAAPQIQIYAFNESNGTITLVDSVSFSLPNFDVYQVPWSPDGQYLAATGLVSGGPGGENDILIYSFNRITQKLTFITSVSIDGVDVYDLVPGVSWSPDGRYLAAGGTMDFSGSNIWVYCFDRGDGTLTQVAQRDGVGIIEYIEWSPDGRYLAAAGTITNGNAADLLILNGLNFPSDNVIKDNTVYCNSGAQYPSGVGICGSSICNYIVGNTAYSNPVNPSIVSSNYQFVCNVFNQLFQNMPTALQNLALGSCDPIVAPENEALLALQIQTKIAQIIPELSILEKQMSIIDSQIDAITACGVTPISSSTTIQTSGSYCLANGVGTIVIDADDVVLNLNNHVVSNGMTVQANRQRVSIGYGIVTNSSSADAITINSGVSALTIQNVTVKSAKRGIYCDSVTRGLIKNCELVSNVTGFEASQSANLVIENVVARSSTQSGFSFVTTSTSTVSNCTALSTGQNNDAVLNNNVYGFVAQNSFSNVFENCIANATQALSTTDYNSIVAGFALTGTSNCNKIIGCEAANAITKASGVTVPYGIYMQPQFDGLVTVTEVNPGEGSADAGRMVSWSPDGVYLAMGGLINVGTGNSVLIYQFDRTLQGLTQVAALNPGGGGQEDSVQAVKWSPSGMYLAVAGNMNSSENNLYVYSFNRINNTANQVIALAPINAGSDSIYGVSWSFDEQYLAVSGLIGGLNAVYVYKYDQIAQNLTLIASVTSFADLPQGVAWSPDGHYLAIGDDASPQLQLYVFNRSNGTLNLVDSKSLTGTILEVSWSYDGKYLAAAGNSSGVLIYSFDNTAQQLDLVASVNPGGGASDIVPAISWSADGKYLAIGGLIFLNDNYIFVYYFDRGSGGLNQVAQRSGTGTIEYIEWSPDGRYLAATGTITSGNAADLIILSGLFFPSENVIKNNTVYCNSGAQYPSGVGICGSSICNYIVGNTAYSNPVNPSIVSSNYQFICNVFSQIFENTPTLLQNLALGSCDPIVAPENIGLMLQQAIVGLYDIESRISVLDASLACSATSITTNTTITSAGYYCLANDAVTNITINADDVVLDLNNHTIGAASPATNGILIQASHTIKVMNGTSRGTLNGISASDSTHVSIENVTVSNGSSSTVGIFFSNVRGGLIQKCRTNNNGYGVEFFQSSNIEVSGVIADSNALRGYSLVESYTNILHDCQALSTGQNNNTELNNNVYGFVAQNSFSNVFENCIANATQALSTTDYNSIVAGFALTGTSNCNKIIGCEAANAITKTSGVTVPYGIYLQPQFDGLISVTAKNTGDPAIDEVRQTLWSPDGIYLAVGGYFGGDSLRIYEFERSTESLTQLDSVSTSTVYGMAWHSSGQYLVTGARYQGGVYLYRFDSINEQLQLLQSVLVGTSINGVSWSSDGQYLVVGEYDIGMLHLYRFNPILQQLIEIQSYPIVGGIVINPSWSADGQYLSVATVFGLLLYRFDRSAESLIQIQDVPIALGTTDSAWSPDGEYLAVAVYFGNGLYVYHFDHVSQNLINGQQYLLGTWLNSVSWSSDGRYLAVAGVDLNFNIYSFDRGSQSLDELQSPLTSGFAYTESWSPDGRYLAVGGELDGVDLRIYTGLTFPSDNVIKNNTVYCNSGAQYPSGVGICGSSICNYIVGNTAYSNPINPSIVSSNYQFVCNVFNPILQNMPSMMQNIALGSCDPIPTPLNVALLLQQANALVDDAGLCGPTAITPSGSTTLSSSGNYCLASDATSDIVITSSCVYLDLSDRCLTGKISIQTSDDVMVANGSVTPSAPTDNTDAATAAITIASTAQYTQLKNILIVCANTTASSRAGRPGISIAGNNTQIMNCKIQSGSAIGSASATPGAGGDAIILASDATQTIIQNCIIVNTGSGGTATAGNTGGRGGHGFAIQSGAVNTEIIACLVEQTGNGGSTSGAGTGGAGGDAVNIQSGAVDTSVMGCTFTNMGTGGTGGTTSGVDGKAVSDAVVTAASLSIIYKNFANNILNPTKFDIQAMGETGVLSPSPPDGTVLNPFANIFTSP